MNKAAVNIPAHVIRRPLNGITMKVLSCIEAEIYENRRASVPIVKPSTVCSGIIVDVGKHLSRTVANELNIYLLSRRVALEKYSRDYPRCPRGFQNYLKPPVQEAFTRRQSG
jgi:hypothetical protein